MTPLAEENEHPGDHFWKMRRGRRMSGSWGRRRHAAPVESTAYRIVCDSDVLHFHLRLWSWPAAQHHTCVSPLVVTGRFGAPPVGMEEQREWRGEQRSDGCAQRTSC